MQKLIQEQSPPLPTTQSSATGLGARESQELRTQQIADRLTACTIIGEVLILIAGQIVGTLLLGMVGVYVFQGGGDANVLGALLLANLICYTIIGCIGRQPRATRTRRLLVDTLLTSVWMMAALVVLQIPAVYVTVVFLSNMILGPIGLAISRKIAPFKALSDQSN